MKRTVLIPIFIFIFIGILEASEALPESNYKPKIGFEPTQRAINGEYSKIEKRLREILPEYESVTEVNFYFAMRNSIDSDKINDFIRCYGSKINEDILALFTINVGNEASFRAVINPFYKNTGCHGLAFTQSGLYISTSKRFPKPFKANMAKGNQFFVSFDELYDPNTRFSSGDSRGLFIGIGDREIFVPRVIGPNSVFKDIFENARQYSLEGTYIPYDDEIEAFTMKQLPQKLINLFQSVEQNRLYFNGHIPESIDKSFRQCMSMDKNEEILFIINTKPQPLLSSKLCQGLVATQKGFHIRNASGMIKYPEKYGYRFIPYTYYKENAYFSEVAYLNYRNKRVTEYIYLTPVDALNLTGVANPFFGKDNRLLEILLDYVIRAVQSDIISSDETKKLIDEYQISKQKTDNTGIANNSTKSFFKTVGDVLMPIIKIATVLAIADSLGDDTCDMPRMPRASQNYGSQMLNRQALSRPNDFNKQMNVYNKRVANAKSHCDDKRKDLGLLLSLIN